MHPNASLSKLVNFELAVCKVVQLKIVAQQYTSHGEGSRYEWASRSSFFIAINLGGVRAPHPFLLSFTRALLYFDTHTHLDDVPKNTLAYSRSCPTAPAPFSDYHSPPPHRPKG